MSTVDEAAQAYIDGIAPQNRPLFDRLHGLILGTYPDAAVGLSYGMPAYTVGGRRLYVAAWKHGLSIYGWPQGREAGFAARHPELKTSKGTIQLSPGRLRRRRRRGTARADPGRAGELTVSPA